jgi:stage V sporulation protein AC
VSITGRLSLPVFADRGTENGHPADGGMYMTEKEYGQLVKQLSPNSPILKDCIWAFVIGGLICTIGQLFTNLYTYLGLDKTDAGTATSMTLIAIS